MPMENCLICGICHGRGREFENQVDDCYLLIDHFVGRFVFESFYSDLNGVVVTALFCLVDHSENQNHPALSHLDRSPCYYLSGKG